MSVLTDILKLFKYDTVADKKQTFNIDKALNENFDKIDNFAKSELASGVYYEEIGESEKTVPSGAMLPIDTTYIVIDE
jgi:hypothetical protein